MGHEFSMNLMEVHFMTHENLVLRLPFTSMGVFMIIKFTLYIQYVPFVIMIQETHFIIVKWLMAPKY